MTSLAILSLVNHEFRSRCYRLLFRSIALGDKVKRGAQDLISLLQENPAVAAHIRVLKFAIAPGDMDQTALPTAVQTITQLEQLKITCCLDFFNWKEVSSSDPQGKILQSTFGHLFGLAALQKLTIENIEDFPISSLRVLQNVHSLDLSYTTLYNEPLYNTQNVVSDAEVAVWNPLTLDSLTLCVDHDPTYAIFFGGSANSQAAPLFDFTRLKSLNLHCTFEDEDTTPEIPVQYLASSHISELSISFGYSAYPLAGFAAKLALLYPTLHKLDFSVYPAHEDANQDLVDLRNEITYLKANFNIRKLAITIYILTWQATLNLDNEWRALDDVLAGVGWRSLQSIALTVRPQRPEEDPLNDVDRVLEDLPQLHLQKLASMRGIRFDFVCQPSWIGV